MKFKKLLESYNRIISKGLNENVFDDSDITVANASETGLKLNNYSIENKEIKNSKFKTVDFINSEIKNSKVDNGKFDDFFFDNFNITKTLFRNCKFTKGDRFYSIVRDRSEIKDCEFKDCKSINLKLSLGGLIGTDFDNCKINSIELSKGSSISIVTFTNCYIGNFQVFDNSKVRGVKFINCKFDSPRIEGYLRNINGVEIK